MTSRIDPTVFPDNLKVDKVDLREQFQVAADEITALQNATQVPRRLALDDTQFDTA